MREALEKLERLSAAPCHGKAEWISWAVETKEELRRAIPALRAAVLRSSAAERFLDETATNTTPMHSRLSMLKDAFRIIESESVPEGEVQFRDGTTGELLGKITGVR